MAAVAAGAPPESRPLCGNGKIDFATVRICAPCRPPGPCACGPAQQALEDCDGQSLPSTCEKLGYAGGKLGCSPECRFDTSACALTSPGLRMASTTLPESTAPALFASGDRVALLSPTHPELTLSWVDPASLEVHPGQPTARSSPGQAGERTFGPSRAAGSGSGWVVAAFQYALGITTWVANGSGGLTGPVETVQALNGISLFAQGEAGGPALLAHQESKPVLTEHGAYLNPVHLELGLVGADGHFLAAPRRASPTGRSAGGNPAAGIGVPGGFLVAWAANAGQNPEPLEILRVGLDGKVERTESWPAVASSLAWARGGSALLLFHLGPDGLWAAPFRGDGHLAGPPRHVADVAGEVLAAGFVGGRATALVKVAGPSVRAVSLSTGMDRVSETTVLSAPGLSVSSALLNGRDAFVVWRGYLSREGTRMPSSTGTLQLSRIGPIDGR